MQTKKKFPVKEWVDEKVLEEGLSNNKSTSATINSNGRLIGSIDNGTSSTRFLVFTPHGRIAASAQVEYTQYFPSGEGKTGWHEHDPLEIWDSVKTCMEAALKALEGTKTKKATLTNFDLSLSAIGITNQRETTIAWNSDTGKPYYNAIVWDDLRTTKIVEEIAQGNPDRFR